jgi:hypothetical protein
MLKTDLFNLIFNVGVAFAFILAATERPLNNINT